METYTFEDFTYTIDKRGRIKKEKVEFKPVVEVKKRWIETPFLAESVVSIFIFLALLGSLDDDVIRGTKKKGRVEVMRVKGE